MLQDDKKASVINLLVVKKNLDRAIPSPLQWSLHQSFIFVDMNGVYFPNFIYVFFSNKAVFFSVDVSVKGGKPFLRQAELIITLGTAFRLLWGLGVASVASKK